MSANQLVEHFFRHESANLVAALTRAFGVRYLDLVEDMVQVAMLEAMRVWKQGEIPDNPAGWLHRVARNRILDAIRREQAYARALALSGRTEEVQAELVDHLLQDEQLPDSMLRMIFVCCHPALERKNQIALALKTLCGFGLSEISRGLLLPIETVKKRIQRAKKVLAEAKVQTELPVESELEARLHIVHDVLYLMFNEGYSTSQGMEPIRDDICEEAVRLCHLLCESRYATSETKALLALLLFQSSRLEARIDGEGAVVLLEEQDRTQWDRRLILLGQNWLARSKTDRPTAYHYEATIAMQHCLAPSVKETDWESIVNLYDRLLLRHQSPVYMLNRAIALGQSGDTEGAMQQLESLRNSVELKDYLLLNCAIAHTHQLRGDREKAITVYRAALSSKIADHEKALLERKIRELEEE